MAIASYTPKRKVMEERLKVLVIGRQAGIQQQVREILDSMGKDVEVLYVDVNTPRPPFLGSPFDMINHPILPGRPSAGKTMDLRNLPLSSPEMPESMVLKAFDKALIAQARVDIPADKPNWRKNRMGFLDGLNKRKF